MFYDYFQLYLFPSAQFCRSRFEAGTSQMLRSVYFLKVITENIIGFYMDCISIYGTTAIWTLAVFSVV
jgi:hypothetical protein